MEAREREKSNDERGGGGGEDSGPRPRPPPHPIPSLSLSPFPGEFPAGTLLTGARATYRIDALLGRGSNGTTYRASPMPPLNGSGDGGPPPPPVALKAVSLRGAGGWKRIELFEREAATLASLDHPGIPAYKEFFTLDTPSDRAFVLVQELVDGRTLGALVGSGERGSVADVAELARQLLAILAYLASRAPPVTHRDVKPENLVLEGGGWGGRLRLVDFGGVAAASSGDAAGAVSTGRGWTGDGASSSSYTPATSPLGTTVIGTFGYMSPEAFRGRAGPAADVYAAGGVLLFALTGRPPSAFPQGRGLRLDLSGMEEVVGAGGGSGGRSGGSRREEVDALLDLVEASLEPEAEDRPTAAEALAALSGAGAARPRTSGAAGGSAFPRAAATGGRRRRGVSTLAGLTKANPAALPSRRPFSTSTSAPPGARSILTRSGRTLTIDVPPAPILAAERAGSAAFALMWNGTIALWTVSALAAGSLLAAAFSLPFWVAGAAVAKDALTGSMARERLEVGPRRWTLLRERAAGPLTGLRKGGGKGRRDALPGGFGDDDDGDAGLVPSPASQDFGEGGEALGGRTSDCRGARLAITALVNGVPRTRLELMDGFNAVPFGEGLSGAEQRWLARTINAHIEEATGSPPDVPPDDEAPPPSVVMMGPPPGVGGGFYGQRGPFDPWI